MFKLSCILSFLTMGFIAHASNPLPKLYIGEDAALIPYKGTPQEQEALLAIFNDPDIYPHFWEGKPWDRTMLKEGNAWLLKHNHAFETKGYSQLRKNKDLIHIAWLLEVKGKLVGRGGFYYDPAEGTIPEVFMVIIKPYRNQKWGTKAFEAMIKWFQTNILPIESHPLRWLAKKENKESLKLAKRFAFKPLMDSNGEQKTTLQDGREYLVFERTFST